MRSLQYRYGPAAGDSHSVRVNDRTVVLVAKGEGDPRRVIESPALRERLAELVLHGDFFGDGAVVMRLPGEAANPTSLHGLIQELLREPRISWAGFGLESEETEQAVFCPRTIVVRIREAEATRPEDLLAALRIPGRWWPLDWAERAFAWIPAVGDDAAVFELATRISASSSVETAYPIVCHPNRAHRGFESQWHLGRRVVNGASLDSGANVESAWESSRGAGAVVSLIDPEEIDEGHGEFVGRVVHAQDVTRYPRRGRSSTRGRSPDADHGTFCAGFAAAAGRHGASGVAPEALLLPIRNATALGGLAEGFALWWAVTHGADVIACPWGPPSLPRGKRYALPPHVRWSLEHATSRGRAGLGTVVLFSAGNGTDTMDGNEYASSEHVVSVGACGADGQRVSSSEVGRRLGCLFPSGSVAQRVWSTTPWSESGAAGFGWSLGGTSAAVAGAAGVVALMLSVRPDLTWRQVIGVLERTCDKIPHRPGEGPYDAQGRSDQNGHGRVNAKRAVETAAVWPSLEP